MVIVCHPGCQRETSSGDFLSPAGDFECLMSDWSMPFVKLFIKVPHKSKSMTLTKKVLTSIMTAYLLVAFKYNLFALTTDSSDE